MPLVTGIEVQKILGAFIVSCSTGTLTVLAASETGGAIRILAPQRPIATPTAIATRLGLRHDPLLAGRNRPASALGCVFPI
jgi:hypothetical protein